MAQATRSAWPGTGRPPKTDRTHRSSRGQVGRSSRRATTSWPRQSKPTRAVAFPRTKNELLRRRCAGREPPQWTSTEVGDDGEAGSALVVVGLSAERVEKEAAIRDDMIRIVHRAGASMTNSLKSPASDKSQWRPSFPLVTTERLTTHIGAAEGSTSVPQAGHTRPRNHRLLLCEGASKQRQPAQSPSAPATSGSILATSSRSSTVPDQPPAIASSISVSSGCVATSSR